VVTVTEKSAVITVRLSPTDLERIETVRSIEKVDRTTLLRDFIEDGLRRRVINIYREGKLTASRSAEILGVPLREFLETLEKEGIPVNWDSETVKNYMRTRYGG
jgi:predicted HTH domain antitoxin